MSQSLKSPQSNHQVLYMKWEKKKKEMTSFSEERDKILRDQPCSLPALPMTLPNLIFASVTSAVGPLNQVIICEVKCLITE